jgi:hypothetical protein
MNSKPTLLYLTDLYFKANGRNYYDEDLYITSVLRKDFAVLICHPGDSQKFESSVDLVVFRNTGPVLHYQEIFQSLMDRMHANGTPCYNSLTGKADMCGKEYLLELTKLGFPVIPTISSIQEIDRLPRQDSFVVKLKNGADSIGMETVAKQRVSELDLKGRILQPHVDFEYEVSFYYIDNVFQYAMYAPDASRRWELVQYQPSPEDLAFAQRFVNWNALEHGIQRVDACRTRSGALLLVELEDLNPYLSLLLLDQRSRDQFMRNFRQALFSVLKLPK